jgi:hypothetical protein
MRDVLSWCLFREMSLGRIKTRLSVHATPTTLETSNDPRTNQIAESPSCYCFAIDTAVRLRHSCFVTYLHTKCATAAVEAQTVMTV